MFVDGTASRSIVDDANYTPVIEFGNAAEQTEGIDSILSLFSRHLTFAPGTLHALEFILSEVTDNVLTHAYDGASGLGWLQVMAQPNSGFIEVGVADAGRGVRDSLRERYPDLKSDVDALNLAVCDHVTRGLGMGFGLAGARMLSSELAGYINFQSGNSVWRMLKGAESGAINQGWFLGTFMSMTLDMTKEIDFQATLGVSPPVFFEQHHFDASGTTMKLRVADEAEGTSSRQGAGPVHILLRNLLALYPDDPIELDFSDINMAQTGFIDELIGSTIAEFGPAEYERRIRVVNAGATVAGLVELVRTRRTAEHSP